MFGAISRAHSCKLQGGMPSGPHAFEVPRSRKNFPTWSTSSVISQMFPSPSVRGMFLHGVEGGRNTDEK